MPLGLAGDKALEAQDADQRRRDAEAANTAAGAAERKKKADEKFVIDCEDKIPGIVDSLSGEGAKEPGDLAEAFAVASLILLVKWPQSQHDEEPAYKVKSTYRKDEIGPLLEEYGRVNLKKTRIRDLVRALKRDAKARAEAKARADAEEETKT